jgi:hypothetical protein
VSQWEASASPRMLAPLEGLKARVSSMGWEAENLATLRFQMLHSLSHAIIKRLAFDAGYAAASIRERIYASSSATSPMCGILIYTADGDSEGSLGGLVRMGAPERFGRLLQAAIQDTAWCSADPVCRETAVTGLDGMNAASCHACILASETSCSFNNTILDRRTLVGVSDCVKPFFDLEALLEGSRNEVRA